MTPDQIREFIQTGEWTSITVELRPSANKSPTGAPQPFYCSRIFKYTAPDRFECTVIHYADPNGKVPLVKIHIKGHNVWQGMHSIAEGAYSLDYVADETYEVTPPPGICRCGEQIRYVGTESLGGRCCAGCESKVIPLVRSRGRTGVCGLRPHLHLWRNAFQWQQER
jgi:hypothetical protein